MEQINEKKRGNKKMGERISKRQNIQEDAIQIINNKEEMQSESKTNSILVMSDIEN